MIYKIGAAISAIGGLMIVVGLVYLFVVPTFITQCWTCSLTYGQVQFLGVTLFGGFLVFCIGALVALLGWVWYEALGMGD